MGSWISTCLGSATGSSAQGVEKAAAPPGCGAPPAAAPAGCSSFTDHVPATTSPAAPEACPAPALEAPVPHATGPRACAAHAIRCPDPTIDPESSSGSGRGRGGAESGGRGRTGSSLSSSAIFDAELMQHSCCPRPMRGDSPSAAAPNSAPHLHASFSPTLAHAAHILQLPPKGQAYSQEEQDQDEFASCRSNTHSNSLSQDGASPEGSHASHSTTQRQSAAQAATELPARTPSQHNDAPVTADRSGEPPPPTAAALHLPRTLQSHPVASSTAADDMPAAASAACPGSITLGELRDAAALYRTRPCHACQAVLQYCHAAGTTAAQLAAQLDGLEDPWGLQRVLHATASLEHAVAEATGEDGWEVVEQKEFRQSFKFDTQLKRLSFKGQAVLEAPVEQLVAICREFDLLKETWRSYIAESTIVHEYTPAELLCAVVLSLPWPLPRLSVVVDVVGAELLQEHGAFLFTCQSPHAATLKAFHLPTTFKRCLHVPILPGTCVVLTPLLPKEGPAGPPRTEAILNICMAAPPVPCPSAVISFVLKVLGPFIFHAVLRVLRASFAGPSTPHARRMDERSDMYDLVRARTRQYLSMLAARQASEQGVPQHGGS